MDSYDRYLLIREIAQEWRADRAIQIGILSDYLIGEIPGDYYFDTPEQWELDYMAEGRREQRFDHTAEELFVWAHEFDMKEMGTWV